MEERINISKKEYIELVEESRLLRHLQANGVDNWEGYSHPPTPGQKQCSECLDEYPKEEMLHKKEFGKWFCHECSDAD